MADTSSFDVTSTIDFAEVDNALNQARKEVGHAHKRATHTVVDEKQLRQIGFQLTDQRDYVVPSAEVERVITPEHDEACQSLDRREQAP